ncbi:MAG: DNA alkylation repair protein [Candidatus Kapabacteria bacterium]|nr:DNA alkylation repair protein [Candidatus Kapabacteria bacterium]
MTYQEVIDTLQALANPENVVGMAKFGIASTNTLGISMPEIRNLAKAIKKDHDLAIQLWNSGFHEARILAALIAEPKKLTVETAEKWVQDFDSWDVCDQVCMNLFDKSELVIEKISEWAADEREFVRRTAFAMIAAISVHQKKMNDSDFLRYFNIIRAFSTDERNFVKKAVNWALRAIGKRSHYLREKAIDLCLQLIENNPQSRSARWIANDALRELKDEKIIARIKR